MSAADRIACPHCRQAIKRPPLPPGASCLCPKCNQPFSLSATGEPTAPPASPPPVAPATADTSGSRPDARQPVAAPTTSPPAPKPAPPAKPAPKPRPAEFSLHCYLCGSLLHARVDQVGTKIQCHDCHAETEVRPPRPQDLRSAADVPTLEGAEEFSLSDPGQRPKFSPIERPRRDADDDEVDEQQFQLKPLPVMPTEAVSSSAGGPVKSADAGMIDLFSQHGGASPPAQARPPQPAAPPVWPTTAIPVNTTHPTHPVPPIRQINAPPPSSGYSAPPPASSPQPGPRIRKHADSYGDELWSAPVDPSRPSFERSPFLVGIVEFLFYPETLVRWLTLVALASIPIAVLEKISGALNDYHSIFSPGVMMLWMFAAATGIPWLCIFGAHAMSIVQDTGRGCDAVEHWPLGGFIPRGNPIYLALSFVGGMVPGLLFWFMYYSSYEGVSGRVPLMLLVSAMLFTPLLWLPMLLEKSLQAPFQSQTFWQSFKFSVSGWFVFYFETFILGLVASAGLSLWETGSIIIAPLSAAILITPLFVYLRLLGRLLWYIDPAMAPPPPPQTKPPPAPLPETVDPMLLKQNR